MRIPVGVDISETWEVDYCLDAGTSAVQAWREVLEEAKRAEAQAVEELAKKEAAERVVVAEKGLAAAGAELSGYTPGTGPVFILGHIPGAKRAEIRGMMADARDAKTGPARELAELAWRREVVRWAVRGHRGLKLRDGTEQAFDGVAVTLAGETFVQPTDRQIERYILARMMGDLWSLALAPQGLGGAEKNA